MDLTSSFYTKGAANLNQALAIASAVLPNSVAIANLQTTVASLQSQIDALTATLNESIAARNVLEARVTALENTYATQSDISALQARAASLEAWAGKSIMGGNYSPFSSMSALESLLYSTFAGKAELPTIRLNAASAATFSNLDLAYVPGISASYLISSYQ